MRVVALVALCGMYIETAAVNAEHTQALANLSLVTTPDWDRAKRESDTLAMISL